MKVKKVTLLVAMVAMVLGIGSYALAQVAQEPPAQEPAAEQLLAQEPAAQGPAIQEAATQEPATQELVAQEEPPAQELPAEQSAAQEPAAQEPAAQAPVLDEASCESTFREEQAELAANGAVYPTSVSEDARACEELGFVNLYPVPYFYDTDGIIYTYDPIADRYTSEADPATGVYHIYDLVTERFYTYDPATGAYL
jgi:hypothetical protein